MEKPMASDSNQVKHWMTPNPHTCQIEDSLADARDLMAEYRCRRLPVLDENGHLIGIVSFGDLRQAAPSSVTTLSLFEINYFWAKLPISDAMTADPETVAPDSSIHVACRLMLDYIIGGLPVVVERKVVGIFTTTDVLRYVVEHSS
jgi:CBS domain-containing protein